MPLPTPLTTEMERLLAEFPEHVDGSVSRFLAFNVTWPEIVFEGSPDRMRQYLVDHGVNAESWSEEQVRDEMPWLREFRFTEPSSRGSFWDGWEQDFPGVDAGTLIPFAADECYFYFITENPSNPLDPCVFSVDHEETDSEPYDEHGLTVTRLLFVLATP